MEKLKEIFAQIHNRCPLCHQGFGLFFLPHTEDDTEKAKEFKLYQVVRNKVYGIKKQRSLKQLNTYWATCKFIADQTDHKQWNTKKKVDFQCRVACHFVDPDIIVVKPDGEVQFMYRSIAFKNLGHIEACNYFERAYGTMVDFWNATHKIKITLSELVSMVIEAIKIKNT